KCFKHSDKDAVGNCSSCGKGVCSECGVETEDALVCKDCLAKGKTKRSSSEKKSPGLAAVLSFFWSGLGQIYNGEIAKGIILLILYTVSAVLMLFLIGCCTTPIIWIYGIYDAYNSAELINKGEKDV
ncbi:MAG: hypothetical protein ABID38_04690, partial [Candidatus Diapherotrites archaeon]